MKAAANTLFALRKKIRGKLTQRNGSDLEKATANDLKDNTKRQIVTPKLKLRACSSAITKLCLRDSKVAEILIR